MRAFAILIALCLATTLGTIADINIIYEGLGGFYRSDDSTGLTSPANGSQTALAQLIFSADNSIAFPTFGGAGTTADDTILDETLITDSGGTDPYGGLPATSYSGPFQAGFIYVRIWDQGSGLGGSGVSGNTWYYNGPLVATIDNNTPANPDTYNANQGTSSSFPGADYLNVQYVPEPATVLLASLGMTILCIRRCRRV